MRPGAKLRQPKRSRTRKPFLPDAAHSGSARVRFARRFAAQDPVLRLYAILDAASCQRVGCDLLQTAAALAGAGVQLFQYRDKFATESVYLHNARKLRSLLPNSACLLLNDYAHLVEAAEADGVHVGQQDTAAGRARVHIGPERILGVSTHSADQALAASHTEADYVAIGPVFVTSSKQDAEPTVGLCGVQAARAVTGKPLVAIGGIGLGDARAVEMAGADSIAIISALLPSADLGAIAQRARDFLTRLQ